MSGGIPPLPQYAFMTWCLVKHRDNFTFTFNIPTASTRQTGQKEGRKDATEPQEENRTASNWVITKLFTVSDYYMFIASGI
jgi:hypothetical protein